jgi:two-component system, OmpR family, sensor kinase
MTIRLTVWLGAMLCATLLLAAHGLFASLLGSWLAAGAMVLALFAPIAWLLARQAYHPVRDVTKTARSIMTTGELDRRCFYPGPLDDVGNMVVVVNELLIRYDAAIGRLRRLRAAQLSCACPRESELLDPADLVVVELMARDTSG